MGRICLDRMSSRVCDGVEDCLHGEDEDTEYCQEHSDRREGRQLGNNILTIQDRINTVEDFNHKNTTIVKTPTQPQLNLT